MCGILPHPQRHPESSGNQPWHDHWHINELSLYTQMPKNQKNPTTSKNCLHCKLNRTARACLRTNTGRTTLTTKVDRKHASSYTVHTCPLHQRTDQCMPKIDCRTFPVSTCTKWPPLMRTQSGRVPGSICDCALRSCRCQ